MKTMMSIKGGVHACSMLAFAAALLIASSAVYAVRVDMRVYENAGELNTDGLDVYVEVTETDDAITFEFHNGSQISCSITDIYFESKLARFFKDADRVLVDSDGVTFGQGAVPAQPLGSKKVGWSGEFFTLGAIQSEQQDKLSNGVDSLGEIFAIRIDKGEDISQGEIVRALNNNGSRISIFVSNVGNTGEGLSFITGRATDPFVGAMATETGSGGGNALELPLGSSVFGSGGSGISGSSAFSGSGSTFTDEQPNGDDPTDNPDPNDPPTQDDPPTIDPPGDDPPVLPVPAPLAVFGGAMLLGVGAMTRKRMQKARSQD